MVFWILVALLAAGVTYAVTLPLLKPPVDPSGAAQADIAVYRDQLAEIDADEKRGAISGTEAEAARAEVARRVLRKVDAAEGASQTIIAAKHLSPLHLGATLGLPLASLAIYLMFGAPGLPGVPLAERLNARIDASNTDDMIAKVEARLRERPEDGSGWEVIAPVYMAQGQYALSASAYANAIRLLGASPRRLLGFADARIRADNGLVTEDARKALQTVLAAEPERVEPRIWLALAKEQDGKKDEALADFRALLAEAAPDAPWRRAVQDRIAFIENPGSVPKLHKGPTADQVAKAEAMSATDRAAMIDRMVNGLAEKLKTNGRDAEGWQRLIQAYQMLGRKDDAVLAVTQAKAGLAGDAAAIRRIEEFAKSLGVGGS